MSTFIGVAAIITCTCASMRPGMSVRPLPSMNVVSARRSAGIGEVEIFSILFPRTRTLDGADSCELLPSKMRTFENTVTDAGAASCAWRGGSTAQKIKTAPMKSTVDFVFMVIPPSIWMRPRSVYFVFIANDHCRHGLQSKVASAIHRRNPIAIHCTAQKVGRYCTLELESGTQRMSIAGLTEWRGGRADR